MNQAYVTTRQNNHNGLINPEPKTCQTCRFGTPHTLNGGTHTEAPPAYFFTCARAHPTCDPDQDPAGFHCGPWQRRQTAAQDTDDLFDF